MTDARKEEWQDVAGLSDLGENGRKVVKTDGKQIVLFRSGDRILACNNRCPHEGFPLSEGNLGGEDGCILTCNWHNWKFDLEEGETLVGGDKLRRYPARVAGDRIQLDLSDPPAGQRMVEALDNLIEAFDRHEYDRMGREIARLQKAGGDPLDALRRTLAETVAKFEYGASHALPASADWLSLRAECPEDPIRRLAMLTECVGHFAWDTRREPDYPYPTEIADWDEEAYVAAVEAEDEAAASARVRGAVRDGLTWTDLERGFARAALAHYADFGHAAIYTYKMRALTATLGDSESLLNLALLLTRSLVYVTREELIPEFRAYGKALPDWTGEGADAPDEASLRKGSVREILKRMQAGSGDVDALYDAAMGAASWQMLHFDMDWMNRTDTTVSNNINWLDFTHALTFGNAVRKLCEAHPDLWPQGLLQMGCFLGRNSGYVDADQDGSPWRVNDPVGTVEEMVENVQDHGVFEYIVACHLLKLTYAVREEMRDRPGKAWHATAAAALSRFLNSPLKRKHTLRTAHQSLEFVEAEG